MQVVCDETFCGPLCQHPSCWKSHQRCSNGLPNTTVRDTRSDSEDGGLPTQKVVNLLEGYGDDPRDRYPNKWGGRPLHERAGSIATLARAHKRDSFPGVRAPHATPATPMRSVRMSAGSIKGPMRKVEVQEVFDLDDLQSDWHETFQPKKYYVWVPKAKPNKLRPPLDTIQSLSIQRLSQGPVALKPRDLTQDMIPPKVEWERMNQVGRSNRRYDCRTPTGGQPYSFPISQDREYNGLYDLLDLPREVLADIVNHIEDRELKSKHEFVEAVIRTLPMLEKNHTAISLASSNVLLQRPVQLLDSELKRVKTLEPFTAKQVYQMDDKAVLDRLSTANAPTTSQMTDHATTGQVELLVPCEVQEATPVLNKVKPLPAIAGAEAAPSNLLVEAGGGEDEAGKEKKIPSIALGLPTIPSGLKYTKTFTYSQQDFDFTLCPIPSPLQGIDVPLTDRHGVLTPTQLTSARATLPTGGTGGQEVTKTLLSDEKTQDSVTEHPSITQMVIHMPKTPNATPVTRTSTFITDLDPSMTPDNNLIIDKAVLRDVATSPAPAQIVRQPLVVTQKSFSLPPDAAGVLQPIAEGGLDELGPVRHQMPVRPAQTRGAHRSVHFASSFPIDTPPIPPQPPSSPIEPDNEISPSMTLQGNKGYQGYTRAKSDGLMVIGKGTRLPGGYRRQLPSLQHSRPPLTPGSAPGSAPARSPSPEPWPRSDEVASRDFRDPTTPPKSGYDQGKQGYDLNSKTPDQSGQASNLTKSPTSSTNQEAPALAAKRVFQEGQLESPAPPPPSPEPRHLDTNMATGNLSEQANNLMMVDEETESEVTISAIPPSNLDSASWIPSPASRTRDGSRPVTGGTIEESGLLSREVTNASKVTTDNAISRESTIPEVRVDLKNWAIQEMSESQGQEQSQVENQPASLDQFEATEESLKQELEREYEKLAKKL